MGSLQMSLTDCKGAEGESQGQQVLKYLLAAPQSNGKRQNRVHLEYKGNPQNGRKIFENYHPPPPPLQPLSLLQPQPPSPRASVTRFPNPHLLVPVHPRSLQSTVCIEKDLLLHFPLALVLMGKVSFSTVLSLEGFFFEGMWCGERGPGEKNIDVGEHQNANKNKNM